MRRAQANPPRVGSVGRLVGIGTDPDEADHYIQCGECGWMIDMRNLGEVLEHEGPHLPPVKS